MQYVPCTTQWAHRTHTLSLLQWWRQHSCTQCSGIKCLWLYDMCLAVSWHDKSICLRQKGRSATQSLQLGQSLQ
jgi:hypothetical protein